MSSALEELAPNAEIIHSQQALAVNCSAAAGLAQVLKSNLGPTGSLKLLVGGTIDQLKLTKDGLTLLKEMQIQHPTAALIARAATAQDDVTGDGTTSTVLLVGALLQQAYRHVQEGMHPRVITTGYDLARDACLEFLKSSGLAKSLLNNSSDNDAINADGVIAQTALLTQVAKTSLQTKLDAALVPQMAAAVVEAIQTIYTPNTTTSSGQQQAQPLDLNRIEILTLPRNAAADSRLVKGLVLDHGNRHPDMPSHLHGDPRNNGVVYIMTCNLSLEYEQTETQATFVYQTAEEREKLVESERQWLDERCRKIVAFKRSVCGDAAGKEGNTTKKNSFCIINQKGVDPLSLDMFAKEGILCLRRAKRRNMERLVLAVGGSVILSLEDELTVDMLGQAGSVRVVSYGGDDNKYTFIEDCRPLDHLKKNDEDEQRSSASLNKSCTLLLQGPNSLTVHQIQDAVKDGLRSVKNAVEDAALIPGGGALELACHEYLMNVVAPATPGKPKVGIQAYAQALLVIPKTLAANSGFDVQEAILAMQEEYRQTTMAAATGEGTKTTTSDGATYTIPKLQYDLAVGFSCKTGEPMLSAEEGVWDNVRVKRQSLYLATVLANQLLLVDEVMRAGKQMGRQPPQGGGDDPMMM